jgi:POT family proton-dependent oligopeptide transporter
MADRSKFPPVFWVANTIEVLERFAYYGIYFGFGIYMTSLGYSRDQLGIVQSLFLLLSYGTPIFAGTFADRYGFKKLLIISYLAYLPAILLLLFTKSFSGIALTMLFIGFAAGIFKPLIAGTVRLTTDATNKTMGFGVYYLMVNIGGSGGPIVAGYLRAISWNYAFIASAVAIGVMMLITIVFYKEPPRDHAGETVGQKLREIAVVLSDLKFAAFLVLLGIFFWLPFWSFFNICALYVDSNLDTASLYRTFAAIFGTTVAGVFSHVGEDGQRRILGESISHTGWIIIALQIPIAKIFERFPAMPSFRFGLAVAGVGLAVIGLAATGPATLVLAGIALFAVGEMISSPRIQEYITWIAPKDKAGLYMGSNFLATMIGGALSGFAYTDLYGHYNGTGNPQMVWYVMAVHMIVAAGVFWAFAKLVGEFGQQEA